MSEALNVSNGANASQSPNSPDVDKRKNEYPHSGAASEVNISVSKEKKTFIIKAGENDTEKVKAMKADIEKEMYELANKPTCTSYELERFSHLMGRLSEDGTSSLLISAITSNNTEVVVALLEKFRSLFYTRNQKQESLLHLACKSKSILRYYYVIRCPALLTGPDTNGTLPLHLASENNDIEFISWLFKCVLQPENLDDTLSMPYIPQEYNDETCAFHPNSLERVIKLSTPSLAVVESTKLLAVTTSKQTAMHIATENGHHVLLSILLKVLVSLQPEADFSIFLSRETFARGTLVDTAIFKRQPEALRVLLEFLESNNLLMRLVSDEREHTLKDAVVSGNIEVVMVLLQFGFHRGIEKAISVASARQFTGALRLLLYYYTLLTQMKDTDAFEAAHRDSMTASKLMWKGLLLEEIQPEFLQFGFQAIASSSPQQRLPTNKTPQAIGPIRCLAQQCVAYFNGCNPGACTSLSRYHTITDVDLSDNHLSSVPPELFQLSSICRLSLAQNALKALPTSNSLLSNIYTSTKLKTLVLDCNQLQTLPEEMMFGLIDCLEQLSVQSNELNELPPSIWIMPHLKKISLSENRISQLHYFDRNKYLKDTKFSTKVVTNLTTGDEKDVTSKSVLKYLKRLRMFCCTLHKVEGEQFDEGAFIQGVLLLHQQRLTQDNMGSLYTSKLYKLLYASSDNDLLKTTAKKLSTLTALDLSHNKFLKIPQSLPCLAPNLQRLDMRFNSIDGFHLVHSFPPSIITVLLGNNRISTAWQLDKAQEDEICMDPHMLLFPQKEIQHQCCRHNALEQLISLHLNNNQLQTLFGDFEDTDMMEQAPRSVGKVFPRLSILNLEHNNLTSLAHIPQLSSLNSLDISFNSSLDTLPHELGVLSLSVLNLDGLKLRGVPMNLSTPKLLKYLKNLLNDAKPYYHMKLVAVGNSGSGKSTLLQQLTKDGRISRRRCYTIDDELSAEPVAADFMEWQYGPLMQKKLTFTTWDFGGQGEFFAICQCFLTHRSLYLVVWNMNEGEQGLRDIKPWLENIEVRAPGSPVIVVGTHGDPCARNAAGTYESLEKLFRELYIDYNASRFAYPQFIHRQCIIINSFDSSHIKQLRRCVYEVATSFQPQTRARDRRSSLTLLEDTVPHFYIQLRGIVRELALKCFNEGIIPIYTDQDYRQAVQLQCELRLQQGKPVNTGSEKVGFSTSQLNEASTFLHNDGVLFQYVDTVKNEYIYCVNPQWLCLTLTRIASGQLKDPRFKNGFVYREDLREIFKTAFTGKNGHFVYELGKFMEKLEVIIPFNTERILIPSLLPPTEDSACIVQSKDDQEAGKSEDVSLPLISFSLVTLEQKSLVRYYILPFIPHDFFPRLIARITGSSILKEFADRLFKVVSGSTTEGMLNWHCWRNGIKFVWNQLEILTITPATFSLSDTKVISSSGPHKVEWQHRIEINVIVLPQEVINSKLASTPTIATSLATWLLQQAVQYIESVFSDWYEAFGRSRGFELSLINSASPCPLCHSVALGNSAPQGSEETRYMFSSIFCARVVTENKELVCPTHGKVAIVDVAPDLMFYDCFPSLVVSPECIVVKLRIGDGGFGTVYSGSIISEDKRTDIAIKDFSPQSTMAEDPEHRAELAAWDKYQNASLEARTMVRLNHDNVLRLLGITLTPMRLLLELAPLGDLKTCVEGFKSAGIRFNRRTLRAVMTQIAGALHHLHSHSIIYQDLKPGNVLLWQFPRPETQWDDNSVVHVKLADYGVCKMDTPQGVKGIQGTPSYLPPEVLLQGGQQGHNTKLDVYAYGMFLYFLFTFLNPFETEVRSVAFLLEEGKRPEFSQKHHPSSLWMLELMCWCWSEYPQHRPTFKEILNLLHNDTITQLISAIPITDSGEEVTAACTRLVDRKPADPNNAPALLCGSLDRAAMESMTPPTLLPQSSQVSIAQNKNYLEVWHGTDGGDVSILQYLPVGCIMKVNVASLKGYVSNICIVEDNVWVATLGDGIHVFDTSTKQCVAQRETRDNVHTLHYCPSEACVVTLEDKYLRIFSSRISEFPDGTTVPLLHSTPLCCQSTLALIHCREGREEIWTATQRGSEIVVFNLNSRSVESIPDQSNRGGFRLRVIESLSEAGEEDFVAISDGYYLEKWNVLDRKKVLEVGCHKICKQLTKEEPQQSTVVSLLAVGGALYAGSVGGIILVLSPAFTLLTTLHACVKLNRYLLRVKSAQNVTLLSKQFSVANRGNVLKRMKAMTRTDSAQDQGTASYSFTLPANIINRDMVISFGQYFDVSSRSSNRPPTLQLPTLRTGSDEVFASRLNKQSSHMLLWSAWSPSVQEGSPHVEKGL